MKIGKINIMKMEEKIMRKGYLGKRIVAFTLAGAMMLGMCACGKKNDGENNLSRTVTEMFNPDSEESTTESRENNDYNSKGDTEVNMYDFEADENSTLTSIMTWLKILGCRLSCLRSRHLRLM